MIKHCLNNGDGFLQKIYMIFICACVFCIVCNTTIRVDIRHTGYMGSIIYKHDYIQCTSVKQKNTFYEFEFHDATESDVSKKSICVA